MGAARLNGNRRAWAELGRGRAAVLIALLGFAAAGAGQTNSARPEDLPDAPSVQTQDLAGGDADAQKTPGGTAMRRCKGPVQPAGGTGKDMPLQGPPPCLPENPVEPIVTSVQIQPLSSKQKGVLALKEFVDPFNFVTIAAYSGIAVASNSHSAYGPAFKGWAKLTGYGLAESAQADFVGTYAIPSVMHEDPRYHRLPTASVKRRLWHAVKHTVVSQSDDGRPMLNYATLLTYPISAELSNLYVPGIPTNGASTARRVAIGYATDPVPQIVAEFLPDVAKHIHIHAQFAQELIDRAAGVNPAAVQ